MVESIFWSNHKLTVHRGHYKLKQLHKECFLGKLPHGLFRTSRPQSPIFEISSGNTGDRVILLVKLQTDCSQWRLYTKITPPRIVSQKSSAWIV